MIRLMRRVFDDRRGARLQERARLVRALKREAETSPPFLAGKWLSIDEAMNLAIRVIERTPLGR